MAKSNLGRPTKYKVEYDQLLISHMTKGLSFDAFAGIVDVAEETIYNWTKQFPSFKLAKVTGHSKRRATLEKIGLKIMLTGVGSTTAWIFFMKNAYHWTDRHEVQVTHGIDFKGMREALSVASAEKILSDEKVSLDSLDVIDIEPLD